MPGLSVKKITKRFDKLTVLDDISFDLEGGELLVLLGPSGCGKSTLLRIIAGLETADVGEIYIDGRRVEQLRPRDRNVALVFQNYSLYPHMTVGKNLGFPLKVAKVPKAEITTRVNTIAAMLGLENRLDDKPGQLSGGQRQRVALGRAIIREPAIFLLDEPLSNLDADLRVRMRQEIVRLQKQLGKTMIHVTHDQAEALTMADKIALLNDGHVIQMGSPEELYKRPVTTFVASFLGQPKINLIDSHIEGDKFIPLHLTVPSQIPKLEGEFILGIRPEAIAIRPDGELLGHVKSTEYLGDHYVLLLDVKGTPLTVRTLAAPPPVEHPVRLTILPHDLMFFDKKTGVRLE